MQHSWLLCTPEGSSVKCPFAQQNTYTKAHEPAITAPPWNSSTVRKWHKKLDTSCSLIIIIGNKNLSDTHEYLAWLPSGEQTSLWRYLNITITVSKFNSSCIYLRRSLRRKKPPWYPPRQLNILLIVHDYNTVLFHYILRVYFILVISYLLSG